MSTRQLREMREARSSYGTRIRVKPRRERATPADAPPKVSQEERVIWAQRRLRCAINRSNACRNADPVLLAAVQGRQIELDRELRALEKITGIRRPRARKR